MDTNRRCTVPAVAATKVSAGCPPLVMVTAWDAPTARIADRGGVDMILVGDSLAMVALGHPDTLSVTLDEMVHHTAAVARAHPDALIVGDLPWGSYHTGTTDAVRAAMTLVRAGAGAVKLEGGANRVEVVAALVDAEVCVMGHVGLTPQSMHRMGGFRVQGTSTGAALALVEDAAALVDAGVFAVVVEGVPAELGELITRRCERPTIGIGAGPGCDGQVLVLADLLGLSDGPDPRFVRRFATLGADASAAVTDFAAAVRTGAFPTAAESYQLPAAAAAELVVDSGDRSAAEAVAVAANGVAFVDTQQRRGHTELVEA